MELKEQELAHEDVIKNLKMVSLNIGLYSFTFFSVEWDLVVSNFSHIFLHFQTHDQEITSLRGDFERQSKEIEQKYEKKMRQLRDELDLRRKTEIHEIEERKNSQINTLMKNHEKAFSDIKNYYNDITLNNLALINSLKVASSCSSLYIPKWLHLSVPLRNDLCRCTLISFIF